MPFPAKPGWCHLSFFSKTSKKTIKCLKWEGDCRQSLLVSSTNEVNSKWIATVFDISIESFIPNHLNQFHIHLDTSFNTYIRLKSNHGNDRVIHTKKNLFYFEVQKGKDFFNNWSYMGRCSRNWADTASMITLVKVVAEHCFSNG